MRLIEAFKQFQDDNGNLLSGGKLKFQISGTTTLKDTYSDYTEETENTNPVILDAYGRVGDVFGSGSYRCTLYDSDDVQIDDFDPIGEIASTGPFTAWLAAETYDAGEIVKGSDDYYYQSLTDDNINNDPTSDTTNWNQLYLPSLYTDDRTYYKGDLVYDGEYRLWLCGGNGISGMAPDDYPQYWHSHRIRFYSASETYDLGEIVQDTDLTLYVSNAEENTGNTPSTDDGTNWLKAVRFAEEYTAYNGYSMSAASSKRDLLVTNEDAGEDIDIDLPAGSAGARFRALVVDDYELKFTANGSEKFAYAGTESAAGGTLSADVVGKYVEVLWGAGVWNVVNTVGYWTFDA